MIEGLTTEAVAGWLELRGVLRRIRRNKSIAATHADLYEDLLARALDLGDLRIAVSIDDLKREIGVKDHRTVKTAMTALQKKHDLVHVIDFSVDYGTYLVDVYPPRPGPGDPPDDAQRMLPFGALDPPLQALRKDCAKFAQSLQGPSPLQGLRKECANDAQTMQAPKSGDSHDLHPPPANDAQSLQPSRASMESMESFKGRNFNLPSSHRTTPSVHGIHGIHGSAAHRSEPPPARNEEPSTGPALMAEGATRYGPDGHRRAEPSGSGIVGAFVELAKQSKPDRGEPDMDVGIAEAIANLAEARKPEQVKQDLERRIIDAVADPKMNRVIAGKAADMVVFYEVPEHEIDRVLRDVDEMRRAGNLRKTPGAFALTKFRALAHNRLPKALAEKLFPLPKKTPETDP